MKDLNCHQCRENQASNLLYFSKYYQHSNKEGYYDPQLICDVCARQFKRSDRMFERMPVLMSFKAIAKAPMKRIMWLCTDKGKEVNDMGYPIWRKKLLRIKKYSEGVLKSPLYWQPMGL